MTAGHKHRHLRVQTGGLVHRALTKPTLWTTHDLAWAERSRMVFGPGPRIYTYRLSPLGVLHAVFGLTLVIEPDSSEQARRRSEDSSDQPDAAASD